jgi:hypothetical protein
MNVDKIAKLARARRKQDPFKNTDALRNHLQNWWCIQYNRPLKDPILKEYALEDLVYEFFVHYYANPENDPIKAEQKTASEKADMEWAMKQMAKQQSVPKQPEVPKLEPPQPEAPPVPDMPDLSMKFS